MTSPRDILTAQTAELDLSLCTERQGVIYLLIADGEIVYVGQSERLVARIGLHISGDRRTPMKRFDTVRWFPCAVDDLDAYEGALIRLLRPRHNRRAPYWKGRDNEVLAALGLPVHDDERANNAAWKAFARVPRGPMSKHDRDLISRGHARRRERRKQRRAA